MRLPSTCFILVFLFSSALPSHSAQAAPVPPSVFNIKDYGATGDGQTKDTGAIRKAIDAAGAAGGGTVYFPPGRFLSGTIFMKNHITLHLESGATLLGSTDIKDFPETIPEFRSYTDNYVRHSLIYGEGLHDIAITGRGAIDGQGAAFQWREYSNRPYVIRFISCSHVLVQDVTMLNSPMWMQHYLACDFVTIRGIHVYNHSTYNNDMIDIDCCKDVHISGCYGSSDDDALTLKSTAGRPTENVTITNCVLGSHCNAIKMGTESNGGFRNITITNCTINSLLTEQRVFYGGPRGSSGISLELVDGGILENITVSNIAIRNVRVPIFLRLGNRARPYKKNMPKPGIGVLRNVVISNITASGVDTIGCSITGQPGHPVENVTLSNIRITFPGGGTKQDAEKEVPEHPAKYPECTMFGTLPAYGFYCRHVTGLRFSNIDLELEGTDRRPAFVFDDVQGLDLEGLAEGANGAAAIRPMLVLKDVSYAMLRGLRPAPGSAALLRLEGDSRGVSVLGCDLSRVKKAFEFGRGVPESALFQAANRVRK
ncbi:MAG: glycoside hydrolase family 28 protein [Gemmatimonadota bacterium]|nr:glycoside hydrolase family 28 protein [Gemmatimonadota bacterium]